MLIKEFCAATELPRDTVRFYVKRGLVKPSIGSRPGNRYQVFDAAQVERATLIKAAQRLGFSLRQIAELGNRYEASGAGSEAKKAVLRDQIARVSEQERELRKVRAYLSAKLAWLESGEIGEPPRFERQEPEKASGRRGSAADRVGVRQSGPRQPSVRAVSPRQT
ncbi:MerR family transcriptional regulator [Nostoc sp. NIES-2111]